MKSFNFFSYSIIIFLITGAIFGKCNNKRKLSTTPTTPTTPATPIIPTTTIKVTLKIKKTGDVSSTDTVTATWYNGNASDVQLTSGIQIDNGDTITLTAHSAKSNIFWNNDPNTFGKTFTLVINKDSIVSVAFHADFYALALNANADYTLQAYADKALTQPILNLTQIPFQEMIYIRVPKPNADNKSLTVTGADNFTDTVATVTMDGNKTVTATYALDTNNFTYTLANNECTVTGYKGSFKNIEVPDTIKGFAVKIIKGSNTVSGFPSTIQSIILQKSLDIIGTNAFNGCSGLLTVTIPEGVTNIDDAAFQDCMSLNHVVLPSTIKVFGLAPFYNCNSLTGIGLQASQPPYTPPNQQKGIFGSEKGTTAITITVPYAGDIPDYQVAWPDPVIGVGPGGRTAAFWNTYH